MLGLFHGSSACRERAWSVVELQRLKAKFKPSTRCKIFTLDVIYRLSLVCICRNSHFLLSPLNFTQESSSPCLISYWSWNFNKWIAYSANFGKFLLQTCKDLGRTCTACSIWELLSAMLMYAAGDVTCNSQQVHDWNVCWNTMYRTVYNFNRWESVKCFISGFGLIKLSSISIYQMLLILCSLTYSGYTLKTVILVMTVWDDVWSVCNTWPLILHRVPKNVPLYHSL